jgi:hypothetical protein
MWRGTLGIAGGEVGPGIAGGSGMGGVPPPPSTSDPGLSQYLDAVLIRASAAMRKTPEVAT